jgi:YrbI family 3-deoxy-D-manno-octulosonate 8-phosphate phosphatase
VLRQFNNRLGGKIALYQMETLDSFQIDEPSDFVLIEHLLAIRPSGNAPDFGAIHLLVLDFDGVLTDNRVWVNQDGVEAVAVHRGDGWGIARLKEMGVEVIVLSTEKNPVVAVRCRKLGISYIQDCNDKAATLSDFAHQQNLSPSQIAYVGNDVNDLRVMRWVGLPIAVADAEPEIMAIAKYVIGRKGGQGAIRELARLFLQTRGLDEYE